MKITRCLRVNSFQTLRVIVVIFLLTVALAIFSHLPVTYTDWFRFFRPASLSLEDPYRIPGVLNPPWTFIILYPLALLPGSWGAGALVLLSANAVAMYGRLPGKILAIALSAPFIFVVVLGQLDALILYGFILPTSIGLSIILIKPQAATLTILNRINRKSLIVLAVIILMSLFIWGLWPLRMFRYGMVPDELRNASLFPYSALLAPVLIYYGKKRNSDALLCWATLCLVPFFQTHSMCPAIAATIRETEDWRVWALISILSWVYYSVVVGWVN